jgi:hypothetical protein
MANMPVVGQLGHIALTAFAINLVVAVVLTFVLRLAKAPDGHDEPIRGDHFADAGDPRVQELPQPIHEEAPSVRGPAHGIRFPHEDRGDRRVGKARSARRGPAA